MARSQVAYQILGSVLVLLPEEVGNNAYFTLLGECLSFTVCEVGLMKVTCL